MALDSAAIPADVASDVDDAEGAYGRAGVLFLHGQCCAQCGALLRCRFQLVQAAVATHCTRGVHLEKDTIIIQTLRNQIH